MRWIDFIIDSSPFFSSFIVCEWGINYWIKLNQISFQQWEKRFERLCVRVRKKMAFVEKKVCGLLEIRRVIWFALGSFQFGYLSFFCRFGKCRQCVPKNKTLLNTVVMILVTKSMVFIHRRCIRAVRVTLILLPL